MYVWQTIHIYFWHLASGSFTELTLPTIMRASIHQPDYQPKFEISTMLINMIDAGWVIIEIAHLFLRKKPPRNKRIIVARVGRVYAPSLSLSLSLASVTVRERVVISYLNVSPSSAWKPSLPGCVALPLPRSRTLPHHSHALPHRKLYTGGRRGVFSLM